MEYPTDMVKAMQTGNLVTWLEMELVKKRGTDNQRERYAAGLLPEAELLQLARDEFFDKETQDLARHRWNTREERSKMVSAMFSRKCAARPDAMSCHPGDIRVVHLAELDAAGWDRLKALEVMVASAQRHEWLAFIVEDQAKTIASGGELAASLKTLSHRVECVRCQHKITRSAAKVTVKWAGRTLVREYAL